MNNKIRLGFDLDGTVVNILPTFFEVVKKLFKINVFEHDIKELFGHFMSPEEFENLKETIEIKSDTDLMNEIKKGLSALKKKTNLYTLEELFK